MKQVQPTEINDTLGVADDSAAQRAVAQSTDSCQPRQQVPPSCSLVPDTNAAATEPTFGAPMLKYVQINLFDSPAQTLVNTVNTVGVMGKGIAAEFKKRYPDMFRTYRRFCLAETLTVGKLYLYKSPNKWVLNFPTKADWRRPSKLEYVEAGLAKFVETYTAQGITSISFPRLGTGNGGLDWDAVRLVMERYLRNLPIPVYIHGAAPAADFVPEHLGRVQKRELRKPRADISFSDFLADIQDLAEGWELPSGPRESEDEPDPLPRIRCASHLLPGEDFAALWYDLRQHGALPIKDFPPGLAAHAESVTDLLLHLGYIAPMKFADAGSGIKFAPAAEQAPNITNASLSLEELD